MNIKKMPVISIVLLVTTLILLFYSVWSIVSCYGYISELMAQGQLVFEGNEYNIVSYYVSSCSQYILFALLFFVISWVIFKNSVFQSDMLAAVNNITEQSNARTSNGGVSENKDESLDEWLSNQDV